MYKAEIDLCMMVDSFSQRKKMREAMRNQPDEEGWTTVSYGRRRAEIEGAEVPEVHNSCHCWHGDVLERLRQSLSCHAFNDYFLL